MIVPNFIMVAAAYTSTLHATIPSTVAMQGLWNNNRMVNMHDKLSCYPSVLRKTMVTIKQCEHNFDVNLGQMSVENQKWSLLSLSEVFNHYKSFNVVRTAVKYRCRQIVSQYNAGQTILSFCNAESFKNSFTNLCVQKDASSVEVKTFALVDEELEEPTWLHTRKVEQKVKIESPPVSLEEDAFAHKESSADDAFTVEDSLVEKEKE